MAKRRKTSHEGPSGVDARTQDNPELCVDASRTGSVARFVNHCCDPNLFVQARLHTRARHTQREGRERGKERARAALTTARLRATRAAHARAQPSPRCAPTSPIGRSLSVAFSPSSRSLSSIRATCTASPSSPRATSSRTRSSPTTTATSSDRCRTRRSPASAAPRTAAEPLCDEYPGDRPAPLRYTHARGYCVLLCEAFLLFIARLGPSPSAPGGHRDRSRPTAHTLESHDPPGPAPRRSSPSPRVKCMGCTSCTTSPPPERAVVSPCSTSNRQRRAGVCMQRLHTETCAHSVRELPVPSLAFFPWIRISRCEG